MAKSKSKSKLVCPKRFRGKKVHAKRAEDGGVRCYIKKRNGQWRFVAKKKR